MYGGDDRRSRRDLWDDRTDEIDHRGRYGGREQNWGDHPHGDYAEHEWGDRGGNRRSDWGDTRDNWDVDQHKQAAVGSVDEEWRHYNRSMDAWNNEDRRRWPQEWRERSRPRSSASHHVDIQSGTYILCLLIM